MLQIFNRAKLEPAKVTFNMPNGRITFNPSAVKFLSLEENDYYVNIFKEDKPKLLLFRSVPMNLRNTGTFRVTPIKTGGAIIHSSRVVSTLAIWGVLHRGYGVFNLLHFFDPRETEAFYARPDFENKLPCVGNNLSKRIQQYNRKVRKK